MEWFIILGFAVSSSMDNFGVGMSYGIRNICVSWRSNLLIAFICFLFSEAGILFGNWLSTILPGIMPVLISTLLLLVIGIRIILLAAPRKKKVFDNEMQNKSIERILKYPESADIDKSGEIGFNEAIVLGIALSANALTNGLGAGLLGLSPLAISLMAAVGSFVAVWTGVSLGHKVIDVRIGSFTVGEFGTMLSGVTIVVIAMHTLI